MAGKPFELAKYTWPISRLGELIENLARKSGMISRPLRLPQPPESLFQASDLTIGAWMDNAAGYLDLEVEPISVQYAEFHLLVQAASPAILKLPNEFNNGTPSYLAMLRSGRQKAYFLCPDLRVRSIHADVLQTIICQPFEAQLIGLINQVLEEAQAPEPGMKRAQAAILRDQLGPLRLEVGWILRMPPSAKLHSLFRHTGVYRPIAILLLMYFVQQLLSIASWFVIGRGIFQGHFDLGWLFAWAILLLSTIPVQVIVNSAQSELSMSVGSLFKQRLIQGTLKLDPEEIRSQGMGQFLNRVMESEAVEMLALSGGFTALLSFIELALAFGVLSRGAGGTASVVGLLIWLLLTVVWLWRYYRASFDWTTAYREMTNRLVEEMVGHRTRLIQENPAYWHSDEDQELDRYLKLSETLDQIGVQISTLVSRGWILVGMSTIALAYITGNPPPQVLAIGLGGVLLASQGLSKLAGGVQSLASLMNAWQQVGPLFKAAARPRQLPALGFAPPAAGDLYQPTTASREQTMSSTRQPLIQAHDIFFRYRPQGRPVLQGCSFEIHPGDRILLEGPSGGGKSTLAGVLTGLRAPESGSLLLWGFDRQILGAEEWRKRVVMAPQFQENYVFSETFAFNLLMGRRWPPQPEDLQEAEAICRELGLGELLERMPSGFQQVLGESGWQLSHGERSRLYIARTLLQKADLIVLDESFGALDPENLQRALQCVLSRAPTVLVIAHP